VTKSMSIVRRFRGCVSVPWAARVEGKSMGLPFFSRRNKRSKSDEQEPQLVYRSTDAADRKSRVDRTRAMMELLENPGGLADADPELLRMAEEIVNERIEKLETHLQDPDLPTDERGRARAALEKFMGLRDQVQKRK